MTRNIYLGNFRTPEAARAAYLEAKGQLPGYILRQSPQSDGSGMGTP